MFVEGGHPLPTSAPPALEKLRVSQQLRAAFVGMSRRDGIATYLSDRDVEDDPFSISGQPCGHALGRAPGGVVLPRASIWTLSAFLFQLFQRAESANVVSERWAWAWVVAGSGGRGRDRMASDRRARTTPSARSWYPNYTRYIEEHELRQATSSHW